MKFYFYDKDDEDFYITLGEKSFETFWPDDGYDILMAISQDDQGIKLLDSIIIIDEQAKTYSLNEFLNILEKLKIK